MTNTDDAVSSPPRSTWAEFDHLAAAALPDPHTMLRELRESCPVGRSDRHGGFWTVTTHAGVLDAAMRPGELSSARPGPGFPVFAGGPPLISSDPPLHRDFRMPLQKFLTPKRAEALRPAIRDIVTELIDGFIERGSADFAGELCIPLPAMVTSELLDFPAEGRELLPGWTASIVAEGPASPVFGDLTAYVEHLYEVRSVSPGDDITSQALSFTVEGRPITREEWVGLVFLLIIAGLDTTSNGGALMLHYLASHPDLRAELATEPEHTKSAVEELLRLVSPVPQHSRGATSACTVAGQPVAEGDVVLLHWLAANRDPAEFPDPDSMIIGRSPNRHVAFGYGAHRCLGSHLAKVELQVLVEEVLGRIPDYQVVEQEVVRYPGLNRGMSALGVRFTPGRRIGVRQ